MKESVKIDTEDGKYTYVLGDLNEAEPIAMWAFYDIVAKHLEAMDNEFKELVASGGQFKFWDTVYVDGIVVAIDGCPVGYVQFLDDAPQVVPFHQNTNAKAVAG